MNDQHLYHIQTLWYMMIALREKTYQAMFGGMSYSISIKNLRISCNEDHAPFTKSCICVCDFHCKSLPICYFLSFKFFA